MNGSILKLLELGDRCNGDQGWIGNTPLMQMHALIGSVGAQLACGAPRPTDPIDAGSRVAAGTVPVPLV